MNWWYVSLLVAALCALWFFATPAKAQEVYLPPRPVFDIAKIIRCIKQAENWKKGTRGAAGERGPVQFTEARWKQCSKEPFWKCGDARFPAINAAAEATHVLTCITECYELRRIPTVYLIALVHAAGKETVAHGTIKALKRDLASRVSNLAEIK